MILYYTLNGLEMDKRSSTTAEKNDIRAKSSSDPATRWRVCSSRIVWIIVMYNHCKATVSTVRTVGRSCTAFWPVCTAY